VAALYGIVTSRSTDPSHKRRVTPDWFATAQQERKALILRRGTPEHVRCDGETDHFRALGIVNSVAQKAAVSIEPVCALARVIRGAVVSGSTASVLPAWPE